MAEQGKETLSSWFIVCPTDGKQTVPATKVKHWPQETAELMGREEYNSATCPKCDSDLEAFQEN